MDDASKNIEGLKSQQIKNKLLFLIYLHIFLVAGAAWVGKESFEIIAGLIYDNAPKLEYPEEEVKQWFKNSL